jgi:hypothetical protein
MRFTAGCQQQPVVKPSLPSSLVSPGAKHSLRTAARHVMNGASKA